MKEITQYICDRCGTQYASKQRCEECEKQHRIPKSIVGALHRRMDVCAKYPINVNIEFDDGSIVTYEKKSGTR